MPPFLTCIEETTYQVYTPSTADMIRLNDDLANAFVHSGVRVADIFGTLSYGDSINSQSASALHTKNMRIQQTTGVHHWLEMQ
jgi:hypothetical protein